MPELTILEACHCLALSEGQKENKEGDEKTTSEISIKTIGIILTALAIPIMIVNIVLLKMPNTDLGASTVLLIVSTCMFFTGLILSHLPHEKDKEEKER